MTTAFAEDFCDNQADGLIPHPTDCTKYIDCEDEKTNIVQCPRTSYFDPNLLTCEESGTIPDFCGVSTTTEELPDEITSLAPDKQSTMEGLVL